MAKAKWNSYEEMRSARFWSRVRKSDGCWEWTGARFKTGYGHTTWHGRDALAHRLSWMLMTGGMPKLLVLHRCDNRACVRPDHLFLGTHHDNSQDMISKGRQSIPKGSSFNAGDSNPRRVLSSGDVAWIRKNYTKCNKWHPGLTQEAIAKKFSITKSYVGKVIRGITWKSTVTAL